MSETNIINNQGGKQILDKIFNFSTNEKTNYNPIIEDSTNISNLISFLKDSNNNIMEKIEIIYILFNLFKSNDLLLWLFMRKNVSSINLYEPLIDLFLCENEAMNEHRQIITYLIKKIRKGITLTEGTLEYVFQKLSYFYENKEVKEERKERLNEGQMLKYLNLLKIFYLGINEDNNEDKNIIQKSQISLNLKNDDDDNTINVKEIKNFIYFNGKKSSISLALNKNSTNPYTEFPTIQFGLSLIMWIYIDENLIKKNQEIAPDHEIKLVTINIAGEQIKLVLKDIRTLQISLNGSDVKNIQTSLIKNNDWNNVCFSILEKSGTNLPIKIFINSASHNSNLTVSKSFPVSSKINEIKLFENFIGKVSSFMLITKSLDQKEANYFSNTKKYGFYKNKELFEFILSNEKKYFEKCKNYKYYEECKSDKLISFYNFNKSKQNIQNLIAIFCPFAYNRDKNQIDDICGHFIGVLGKNDGVNYYINNTKSIGQLGGINNLLPIIELMYSTISISKKNRYNNVDKSILTQSTFFEYLNLIKDIIIDHSHNLSDAIKTHFFSSLSLFIEKFPSNLFTPKILHILLDIGKENFQYIDKFKSEGENYLNSILLNEKIISKYSVENQVSLWKNLYSFFTSDDTQIKDFFNIKKICILLRFIDEKRYNEYCCKRHADLFKNNDEEDKNCDMNIMEPEMNIRLEELFKIIQIYVDSYFRETQTLNLFQLLALDLSPCLQKKIIQVYINYFNNKKIENRIKEKSLEILIKNYFIELIEYAFSISLFDVKLEILFLFKIILDNPKLKPIFQKYKGIEYNGMNKFYIFIADNLLPNQLYVKVSNNSNNNIINDSSEIKNEDIIKKNSMNSIKDKDNTKKELISINNFFNKETYEKEVQNIWKFLVQWMLYKDSTPNSILSKKKQKEINKLHNFIIDFCITFVSRCPFNHIDLFMLTLRSYFKNESIINRDILYQNDNLYSWLIETIYYFHNRAVDNIIYKKEDIISIKKNSLDLFEDFFIHRRTNKEINKRIQYILKYSLYLRKIIGDTDDKKIAEITRITRELLLKIKDISSLDMNYKTKFFFDFIIFHKDFNQLTGKRKSIANSNNKTNKTENKSSFRQTMTMNFSINDYDISGSHKRTSSSNIFNLEIIEEDNSEKSYDDFNNKINNYVIINKSINIEENKNKNEDMKDYKDNNNSGNRSDIIPSYVFNSLHYQKPKDKEQNEIIEENKGKNLIMIWDDFYLYDNIIDYYSSNIWGTENLRKKVKADTNENLFELCKTLIKEYGENKNNNNKLVQDILQCFNINKNDNSSKKQDKIKDKVKINILNINVILLCVAIEITQDELEKDFLERKLYQFIIFCVMASINTNNNQFYYDLIQNKLYDALGFCFMFLKRKDKETYQKFLSNLIFPILYTDEVKKFKIFKTKKHASKNSAIYRLFELRERKKDELEDLDDLNTKGNSTARNTLNPFNKNKDKELFPLNKTYKDDSNIKNNNNLKVVFIGDQILILKHLFDETLNKVKEEAKMQIGFKTNYNNVYNIKYITGNTPTDEKLRINKILKKIIPSYGAQIKNYANDEYLQEKRRRIYYKNNKAKLFSWKGFWSNKYLFYEHPELLKLKIKNHYTKEMIRPLLVPILDLDYYTPPFKKFDKNKLFKNNNYSYNINLDIDDILLDENEKEKENEPQNEDINANIIIEKEEKEEIGDFQSTKNKHGFNYLECIYKYTYNNIWENYILYNKQKINFEQLISKNKDPLSTLINTKNISKKIENIQRENTYNCCIVKLTHHIRGYVSVESNRIRFIFASNSDIKKTELENDLNYDKDMQCCYGSLFKYKKNNKDKILSIDYANIKYIFLRQYFYSESALEIFTSYNKSYFFNFQSDKYLNRFKTDILFHIPYTKIKAMNCKGKKVLGFKQIIPNIKKKNYYIGNKVEDWHNNSISTLEYLMWLNIFSGRSFNDLSQYPVFPWLITNYNDDSEEVSFKNDLRNLNIPMGMIDSNDKSQLRKETFIETYESIKNDLKEMFPDFNYQEYLKKGDEYLEIFKNKRSKKNLSENNVIELNQIPYFYGSHYSNATYVSHFLVRTFPYTYISIEIQGERFDDPDRLFSSMQKTYESASTLKDDVRELIPEFYTLPDMFLNKSNLNLDQNMIDSNNNYVEINDVKLPLWCKNNAIYFVIKLRRYLENNNIISNLNKWIDLIFGVTQRGEKAEDKHNIFQAHTYDKNVKIDKIEDVDSRSALMRLYEMGVTPYQIFEGESKNKSKNNSNGTLDESKNLIFKKIISKQFNNLKNKEYENNKNNDAKNKEENNVISSLKIMKIAFVENEKIKIFTNKNQWYTMKIEEDKIKVSNTNNVLKIEESNVNKYFSNSNQYSCSYMLSDIEIPTIVFNDNKCIIKGGFWNGRLEFNNLISDNANDPNELQMIFNPDQSPITTMAMIKNEKLLFCGTKDGSLILYEVDKKIEYKKSFYIFDDEITSISINDTLNMIAISSKDGFINLYILPTFKLVRTICLNKQDKNKNKNNNEKNDNLYANHIFLSNSPLASIILYNNSKRLFKSFTINGEFICEINEDNNCSRIKSPIMYTNNSFQDILLYGTDKGIIKMRKFPEMTLVNSKEIFPGEEINTICISPNKKICYVCSSDNAIAVVKDSDIN